MHERIQDGALTEVTLLVLLSLYEDNHGYGIMQFVKEQTSGRVNLGAGTLYGALNTLEKKEWIKAVEGQPTSRKKMYRITSTGKDMIRKERIRMQEVLTLMDEISKEDE